MKTDTRTVSRKVCTSGVFYVAALPAPASRTTSTVRPNGHLYVVSLSNGAIYEINRRR
jgi:hypothetical protein